MSARSRALKDLAAHFDLLAEKAGPLGGPARYTTPETWIRAADMTRRTAEEWRWRERIPAALTSWRVRAASVARTWWRAARMTRERLGG